MQAATERVTVFVADDHPLVREGMLRALSERPAVEVVGSAGNGREALPFAVESRHLREALSEAGGRHAVLEVKVPGAIAERARVPIERMVAIG